MRLLTRLERLEKGAVRAAPARICAGCGGWTDWRARLHEPTTYTVCGVRDGEPPITGPDVCPECGRTLVYRVEFDRGGRVAIALLAAVCGMVVLAAAVLWSCH